MEITRLEVGQLQTNCYLVSCSETREAVIIDPGDDGDFVARRVGDLSLEPKLILATHGHFDHVLAVTELKLLFNIPFLMHGKDLFLLKRLRKTAEHFLGYDAYPEAVAPKVDRPIKEGDVVFFGEEQLKVFETPGHTPGSVSCYAEDEDQQILFSGDTLFRQGVGRADFSYGSSDDLRKSLRGLSKLSGGTVVYPGHGEVTDIAFERLFLSNS